MKKIVLTLSLLIASLSFVNANTNYSFVSNSNYTVNQVNKQVIFVESKIENNECLLPIIDCDFMAQKYCHQHGVEPGDPGYDAMHDAYEAGCEAGKQQK